MKVQTIEYSRLQSFGTFNNVRVGCTVEVEDGDSPHMALVRAQSWVQRELERMVGKDALRHSGMAQREIPLDEEPF